MGRELDKHLDREQRMKESLPVIACYQRSENKLYYIKQDPDGEKCSYRDLSHPNSFLSDTL